MKQDIGLRYESRLLDGPFSPVRVGLGRLVSLYSLTFRLVLSDSLILRKKPITFTLE